MAVPGKYPSIVRNVILAAGAINIPGAFSFGADMAAIGHKQTTTYATDESNMTIDSKGSKSVSKLSLDSDFLQGILTLFLRPRCSAIQVWVESGAIRFKLVHLDLGRKLPVIGRYIDVTGRLRLSIQQGVVMIKFRLEDKLGMLQDSANVAWVVLRPFQTFLPSFCMIQDAYTVMIYLERIDIPVKLGDLSYTLADLLDITSLSSIGDSTTIEVSFMLGNSQ